MTPDRQLSGIDTSAMDWLWFLGDKVIDLAIGVIATFLGVMLVYLATKPKVLFDENLSYSLNPDGRTRRYRIRMNPAKRWPRIHMRVSVALVVPGKHRSVDVPIPLSGDEWLNARRSKRPGLYWATPRLRLAEIEWRRYLPHGTATPRARKDLPAMMRELNAKLQVTVQAESTIFAVRRVSKHWYLADQIAPAPDGRLPGK